jgi:hypothetical protein
MLSTLYSLQLDECICVRKYILFRDKNVSVIAVLEGKK